MNLLSSFYFYYLSFDINFQKNCIDLRNYVILNIFIIIWHLVEFKNRILFHHCYHQTIWVKLINNELWWLYLYIIYLFKDFIKLSNIIPILIQLLLTDLLLTNLKWITKSVKNSFYELLENNKWIIKGNSKITELRTILQRESQNS